MKTALKQLIDDLDAVYQQHHDVHDTVVREKMYEAVRRAFIVPESSYTLPDTFGMYSDEGDRKVRAALQRFLTHPEVGIASATIATPKERLAMFQNRTVKSDRGFIYEEYFGDGDEP